PSWVVATSCGASPVGSVASTRADAASMTVAVLSRMLLATMVPCGVSGLAEPSVAMSASANDGNLMAASVGRCRAGFNPHPSPEEHLDPRDHISLEKPVHDLD